MKTINRSNAKEVGTSPDNYQFHIFQQILREVLK